MTLKVAAKTFASVGLALTCAISTALSVPAQENKPPKPSLQAFFDALVSNPSSPPPFQQLHQLTLEIANAPSEEIKSGLPSVLTALGLQTESTKAYACAALFAIARRPDGASLLERHVPAIGRDLLSTKEPNIRAGEITILGSLKPPPREVVPILTDFLRNQGSDAPTQGAAAIFQLIQLAPENPKVVAAIQEFFSRPMDKSARIAALNALGNPRIKDSQLFLTVISFLDGSDQDVRATAIQAVTRMSREALELAEPTLLRLAKDPTQPEQITNDAKHAIVVLDSMRKAKS